MILKKFVGVILSAMFAFAVMGCTPAEDEKEKIGVAFGVGPASRWAMEKQYMEEYAKEQGIELEARLNTDEAAKPLA